MTGPSPVSSLPLLLLAVAFQEERNWLCRFLESSGYEVRTAGSEDEAVNLLESTEVQVVLCDLHGPGVNGMKLLQVSKRLRPDAGVILLAESADIEACVQAMKLGAYDFLVKPVNKAMLITLLDRMIEFQRTLQENAELHRTLDDHFGFPHLVAHSSSMKKVLSIAGQVAQTKSTALLVGESGTGKDLLARAIHHSSPRKDRAFVKMNCGALAESLAESELFGHEKGSFTGAHERRKGRFELADKGTLFLDEVGELTPRIQVKLLRILEDGRFERVGGTQTQSVDVRLIAATNRNLEEAVRQGQFREDLYYRLKVMTIELPPLRERVEDIPGLCLAFLKEFVDREGKNIQGITEDCLGKICQYSWPGNVRELRHCIERMVVLGKGPHLDVAHLPEEVRVLDRNDRCIRIPIGSSMVDAERIIMAETLRSTHGNKSRTASLLGIGLRSVYRKIEKYGLISPEDGPVSSG